MKNTAIALILTGLVTASASLFAASHAGAPAPTANNEVKKVMPAPVTPVTAVPAVAIVAADMTDGEVRKIDKENSKITLKHGAIKNLDMPGMTMVFQVKNTALLDGLKAGDKVKFKAEQAGSAIMVTDIQPAK